MDIIQYLGKKVDLMNKIKPTLKEIRSFMYLQELVCIFAKKEKQIREKMIREESASPTKPRAITEKTKKNTQATYK